ncbi:hypothetical protein GGI16_007125 [Coemansia sp. S142-1]|nr:hypothetical protein GGI16_007125 [Coemansia sp. S142-1]
MAVTGIQIQGPHDPLVAILVAKARSGELGAVIFERYQQALAAQRQQQAAGANPLTRPAGNSIGVQQPIHGGAPVQNSPALVNSLPPNAPPMTPAMGMARPPVAGLPHAIRPSKLPRDSANPSLQDRAVLLEMMQRQREAQLIRPMQQPGATVAPQSRPAAPMMTSPANVPQVMTAAQRQVLQQNALANMTPQQQQEVYMRMQQARQQAAMAPQQQPQISVAMVVQQLLAGQINPEQLPPQAISILWQSAQSHMNPEQRMALQRILSSRVQQIQNNAAQAGAVRPGAAQ